MDELARFPECDLTEEALVELVNKRESRGLDEVFNIYMGRMYFFSLQFVPTEEVSEEIAVSSMEAFWKNGHKNYTSLCEVRESLFDNLTTRCTNAVKQEEGVFLIADKQLNTQQLEKHIKISNLKAEVAFIYHLQKEKKNGKDDGEENKPEEPKKENPEENNENKNDPES